MKKVFCFGEVLVRYSPDTNGDWLTKNIMPAYIGGAELNVATALAKWLVPVKYCTALPDNFLSEEIEDFIIKNNIDTSAIHHSGNRVGIYYLKQGADLKHASVIYDRAWSSFSQLQPEMIDWDIALQDVSWFHFSAISPGLNENIVTVCNEALEAASKKGITISVDLNYRDKLWQYGKEPKHVMPELVKYCDVVMGNIWAANTLLGVDVDEHIHDKKSRQVYLDHSRLTANAIQKKYSKCKVVANTFRFDEVSTGIQYFTSLHTGNHQYLSPEFVTDTIINKIGTGDCFMAGLIYGLYNQHAPQQVIDFATSAAFGKLQEEGDVTNQDVKIIQERINNRG